MKYIKDINNFKAINEAVDVYDFGRKRGWLEGYYNDACKLTKEFQPEVIEKLKKTLPDFTFDYITGNSPAYGEYYLYLTLDGWHDNHWIIQYYGDFCYGVFRFDTEGDDDGDLDWVEFCDELEPVIKRLLRNKRKLIG